MSRRTARDCHLRRARRVPPRLVQPGRTGGLEGCHRAGARAAFLPRRPGARARGTACPWSLAERKEEAPPRHRVAPGDPQRSRTSAREGDEALGRSDGGRFGGRSGAVGRGRKVPGQPLRDGEATGSSSHAPRPRVSGPAVEHRKGRVRPQTDSIPSPGSALPRHALLHPAAALGEHRRGRDAPGRRLSRRWELGHRIRRAWG
mmetsp:Transcript_109845/g.350385  ORF Transcript_109845/g.350385 Transcript_109845/m.350385 type:complete len:203 (+) Transcript_109845:1221-1829(+)